MHDIAVIGGGPAGTHAAWKAALLYRTAVLFDKGRRFSRIYWSPQVDNLPGQYAIKGRDIVGGGYDNIATYQEDIGREFVTVHEDKDVTQVRRLDDGYEITASSKDGDVVERAKVVVFATGCQDAQPKLAEFRKRDIEAVLPYANKGLADYCLLCDGHTVEGKDVAVIGCVVNGPGEAAMTDLGFTGGGKESGKMFISGKADHNVSNADMVEHIVGLVEEKAERLRAQREEDETVAAE